MPAVLTQDFVTILEPTGFKHDFVLTRYQINLSFDLLDNPNGPRMGQDTIIELFKRLADVHGL